MQRFNIAYQYYQQDSEPDPDLLGDMIAYFKTHAKVIDVVNEQTIISFLLLKLFQKKYSFLKVETPSFRELIENVEDPLDIYEAISLQELRNDFLRNIKESTSDDESTWQETYIRLFFLYPSTFIYEELDKASLEDHKYVKQLVHDLMVAYKEYREAFFWLVPRVLSSKEKAEDFGVNYETVLFSLLHLIELAGNSITIKKETTKNKKLQNQVRDYLFKNTILENYIETASLDFANRLYKITIDLNYLGEEDKVKIKDKIAECYPDIAAKYKAVEESENEEIKIRNLADKLLTLRKSLEEKKKELAYIQEVEVPQNSKDIGEALEKGDLRENSEYKAAKEKESQLAARVTELANGINEATIIERSDVNPATVSFGTKIEVLENSDVVKFTILGPWESDIENNVLSYRSPLGMALLGKKVGDVIDFNDKKYSIKSIEVADFE
jgi:transcription elongation factor GreA